MNETSVRENEGIWFDKEWLSKEENERIISMPKRYGMVELRDLASRALKVDFITLYQFDRVKKGETVFVAGHGDLTPKDLDFFVTQEERSRSLLPKLNEQ